MGINKELSYLHFAAWYGQHEYVSLKVSEDPTLLKGNGEMSILLSASIGRGSETVRVLSQAGADPQEQVKLLDNQDNPEARTTTVWLAFLFLFATSILWKHSWVGINICSWVLEEYLKFGVDTDIFFLLERVYDKKSVISQSEQEIRSMGNKENKRPEHELFSISLKDLVRLSQPKNVDTLQTLLLEKTKQPFWSKTSSVISKYLPWTVNSTATALEYKAFGLKELEERKFSVHSVCSKTCRLEGHHRVRIC
jgi:hypothetical protein